MTVLSWFRMTCRRERGARAFDQQLCGVSPSSGPNCAIPIVGRKLHSHARRAPAVLRRREPDTFGRLRDRLADPLMPEQQHDEQVAAQIRPKGETMRPHFSRQGRRRLQARVSTLAEEAAARCRPQQVARIAQAARDVSPPATGAISRRLTGRSQPQPDAVRKRRDSRARTRRAGCLVEPALLPSLRALAGDIAQHHHHAIDALRLHAHFVSAILGTGSADRRACACARVRRTSRLQVSSRCPSVHSSLNDVPISSPGSFAKPRCRPPEIADDHPIARGPRG